MSEPVSHPHPHPHPHQYPPPPPLDLAAVVRRRERADARAKAAGAEVLRSVLAADPASLPPAVAAARARLLAAGRGRPAAAG